MKRRYIVELEGDDFDATDCLINAMQHVDDAHWKEGSYTVAPLDPTDNYSNGYEDGWNACLRDGDEEE